MFGNAFSERWAAEAVERFHFEKSTVTMEMKSGGAFEQGPDIGIGDFDPGFGRGMQRTDGASHGMHLTKQ